ncbi:transporter substrate-binding domain-containing protein, partial [bacterium]|nr:transporter substrate-binding domain-containing protein [bacterium]
IALSLLFAAPFTMADTFSVAVLDWTPFSDMNRADKGISIAILDKVMKTQGHELKLTPMPWARSLVMLEKQKVDILPAVWFTEERTKTMSYSDSYAANRLIFITKNNSEFKYNDTSDLSSRSIGVIRGYAYKDGFLQQPGVRFSEADTLMNNVKKVQSGRIDMTISDEVVAKTLIPKPMMKTLKFTEKALDEQPLYLTCSIKNPKCSTIISAFNTGLEKMKADGSYNALIAELGL